MASRPTKLKPAPLAYPNGGGLKSMGNKSDSKMKDLEHQIIDLQTQLNHHKVDKKYQPKPMAMQKTKPTSTRVNLCHILQFMII